MKLNELGPKEGSTKARTRVGRGIGSGKGKTAGAGHKGQKARTGVAIKGFEGGQMPLYRRLPKRGFNNIHAKKWQTISLEKLQAALDSGRLDSSSVIDEDALVSAKLVRRKKDGIRLLATGDLKAKVSLKLSGASAKAVELVQKAGGTIELTAVSAAEDAQA